MQLMSIMARVPRQILMPTVLLVTITSVYAQETSLYALICLLGFGLFGLFMRLASIPILPFVIAYILGNILERTARQAFSSTGADPYFLFSRPTSILLMLSAVLIICIFTWKRHKKRLVQIFYLLRLTNIGLIVWGLKGARLRHRIWTSLPVRVHVLMRQ